MAKKRIGENPLDSLIPSNASGEGRGEGGSSMEVKSQNDEKTSKQNASKTVSRQTVPEKVKVTYYIEPDDEEVLERAWMELRRLSGRKVSKSEVVAAALRQVGLELAARGAASSIAKALAS